MRLRGQVDSWKAAMLTLALSAGSALGGHVWGYHQANVEMKAQVDESTRKNIEQDALISKALSAVDRTEAAVNWLVEDAKKRIRR